MDARAQWSVSSEVETLVNAIAECKQGLIDCVKKRNPYNRYLKTVACDAYASPKLVELLSYSQLWKAATEKPEGDEGDRRRQSRSVSELVADFELFKLHRDEVIGDETIRLVMTFETSSSAPETFYGTVDLLT